MCRQDVGDFVAIGVKLSADVAHMHLSQPFVPGTGTAPIVQVLSTYMHRLQHLTRAAGAGPSILVVLVSAGETDWHHLQSPSAKILSI